jgi:hypothetical protein
MDLLCIIPTAMASSALEFLKSKAGLSLKRTGMPD